MLRFRLLRIPFEIGIYFWVGSALFGSTWATGPNASVLLLVWVACVFVSIIVHELGHALTARRFGADPTVELHALGGVTRMFGRLLTRAEGFWVTLAGPLAGFALLLVAYALRRSVGLPPSFFAFRGLEMSPALAGSVALFFLVQINLYWTIFNLLPILPLDGGQLLRAALGPRYLNLTQAIGACFAGALTVLALFSGQWYIGLFLGYLAFVNFRGNPRSVPGGISQ